MICTAYTGKSSFIPDETPCSNRCPADHQELIRAGQSCQYAVSGLQFESDCSNSEFHSLRDAIIIIRKYIYSVNNYYRKWLCISFVPVAVLYDVIATMQEKDMVFSHTMNHIPNDCLILVISVPTMARSKLQKKGLYYCILNKFYDFMTVCLMVCCHWKFRLVKWESTVVKSAIDCKQPTSMCATATIGCQACWD